MLRLLALLAWPLTEIGLFVLIGGEIGLLNTLLWVLATGVFGVWLLKREAARGAIMMRGGMGQLQMTEGAAVGGLFRALAAVLLILPGFFTDAIGILFLLPAVQNALSAGIMSRISIVPGARGMGGTAGTSSGSAGFDPGFEGGFDNSFTAAKNRRDQGDIIDGEWMEVPSDKAPRRPPSGWVEDKRDDQAQ